MIFSIVISLSLRPGGLAGKPGGGAYLPVFTMERPSVAKAKRMEPVVLEHRHKHHIQVQRLDDEGKKKNIAIVIPLPPPIPPPLPVEMRTDMDTHYTGTVKVRIETENLSKPPSGAFPAVVESFETRDDSGTAPASACGGALQLPGSDGDLTLSSVPLDCKVHIKLAPDSAQEWSIDADEKVLAAFVPADKETSIRCNVQHWEDGAGNVIKTPTGKIWGFSSRPKNARHKVYVKHQTLNTDLDLSADPVIIRRKLADFTIARPAWISGGQPKAFIGTTEVKLAESGDKWSFTIPREDVVDKDGGEIVVQYDTAVGGFGGTARFGAVDFYKTNEIPASDLQLTLESIATGGVALDGKAVSHDFPLSPLQWSENLVSNSGSPDNSDSLTNSAKPVTGKDALDMLGMKAPDTKDRPGSPQAKDQARFGVWLWTDRGLGIHCRYDPDDKHKGAKENGKKFLPTRADFGIVDSIRVLSSGAGSVGEKLKVGASRAEVLAAFGPPDSPSNELADGLSKIGIDTPQRRSAEVFGNDKIEAWDDTYLYGGIRIKWDGDTVKWFELTRPVQLLCNGTKAFEAPPAETYWADIKSSSPVLRDYIATFLSHSSGLTLASGSDAADVHINVEAELDFRKTLVTHGHVVNHHWEPEPFQCEQISGGCYGTVTVRGVDGRAEARQFSDEIPAALVITSGGPTGSGRLKIVPRDGDGSPFADGWQPGHVAGRQCIVNVEATTQKFLGNPGNLGFTNRALTQASTGATDMMGSVLAVNYDTGEMLISLGTGQGIRAKTEAEGTELEGLLLEDVDPATGAGTSRQTIEDERIVGRSLDGKGFEEWIEVQRVLGPNLCIGIPKHKVKKFLNSSTETAWSAVARLAAPNSGLLRVKIAPKTGAR